MIFMPVEAKKDTRRVTPDPAGPATIVEQPDETKLKSTVTQAAKDRTITGNVGVLDALDTRINPAEEDGNLASIKAKTDNIPADPAREGGNLADIETNTDNLDITQSSFRDALLGAGTKDFSTIQTTLDSIKDTDGIKKITDAVTVIQPNPALLTGTVTQLAKDRTVTNAVAANLKNEPDGNVAHDAVDSGNPVKAGGKAVNFDGTVPGTAVAENDRVNFIADVYGRQFIETAHPNCWDISADYAVAQTNTSIKASPGAGLRLYITDILISNGATAGNITLLDGAGGTVKWDIYPAINGGCVSNLKTPIKLTVNTALCITSTTVTTHSVTICGFIAPG